MICPWCGEKTVPQCCSHRTGWLCDCRLALPLERRQVLPADPASTVIQTIARVLLVGIAVIFLALAAVLILRG